jgi:predicted Rossmann fold flavoprotein
VTGGSKGGVIQGVVTREGETFLADAVIIATGGKSYPATGSGGDGYELAKQAGHTVTPLHPSLVPIETVEAWPQELTGLSLRNVEVRASAGGKTIGSGFGEMLFTHFGVSGPVILSLSDQVAATLAKGEVVKLAINLKPALSYEQVELRIQRDLDKFPRKQLINALHELLPLAMIPVVIELAGIDHTKMANQINKDERKRLAELLTTLPLKVKGLRPLSEAIVTAGGVCLKEVDPKTMASRLVKGLYFAGEVLDIHGFTGGYNLQAAFATGHAAAKSAVFSSNEE